MPAGEGFPDDDTRGTGRKAPRRATQRKRQGFTPYDRPKPIEGPFSTLLKYASRWFRSTNTTKEQAVQTDCDIGLGADASTERCPKAIVRWGWSELDARKGCRKTTEWLEPAFASNLIDRVHLESESDSQAVHSGVRAVDEHRRGQGGSSVLDHPSPMTSHFLYKHTLRRKRRAHEAASLRPKKSRIPRDAPRLSRGTRWCGEVSDDDDNHNGTEFTVEHRGLERGSSRVSVERAVGLRTIGDTSAGFEKAFGAAQRAVPKELTHSAPGPVCDPDNRERGAVTAGRAGKLRQAAAEVHTDKTLRSSHDALFSTKNQEAGASLATAVRRKQDKRAPSTEGGEIDKPGIGLWARTVKEGGTAVVQHSAVLSSKGDIGRPISREKLQTRVADGAKAVQDAKGNTVVTESQTATYPLEDSNIQDNTSSAVQTSSKGAQIMPFSSKLQQKSNSRAPGGKGKQESTRTHLGEIHKPTVCKSTLLEASITDASGKGNRTPDFSFVVSSVPELIHRADLKPGAIFPAGFAVPDAAHSSFGGSLPVASAPAGDVPNGSGEELDIHPKEHIQVSEVAGDGRDTAHNKIEYGVIGQDKGQWPSAVQMKKHTAGDMAVSGPVRSTEAMSADKGSSIDDLHQSQAGLSTGHPATVPSIFKLGHGAKLEKLDVPKEGDMRSQESASSFSFCPLRKGPAENPLASAFPTSAPPSSMTLSSGGHPLMNFGTDSSLAPVLPQDAQVAGEAMKEQDLAQPFGSAPVVVGELSAPSFGSAPQSNPSKDASLPTSPTKAFSCGPSVLDEAALQTGAPNVGGATGFPRSAQYFSAVSGDSRPESAFGQGSSSLGGAAAPFSLAKSKTSTPNPEAVQSPATSALFSFQAPVESAFGAQPSGAVQQDKATDVLTNVLTSAPFSFNASAPVMEAHPVLDSTSLNASSGQTGNQMIFTAGHSFGTSNPTSPPFGAYQPTDAAVPFGAPTAGSMFGSSMQGSGAPLNFSFGASPPGKGFVFGTSTSANPQEEPRNTGAGFGPSQAPVLGSFTQPSDPGAEAAGAPFSMGQAPTAPSRPNRRLRAKRSRW